MYEYEGISIIPILMGLSELLKWQGLNAKLIPIINVILGIIFGVMMNTDRIFYGITVGITMALTSMGIYSTGKNSIELFKQ